MHRVFGSSVAALALASLTSMVFAPRSLISTAHAQATSPATPPTTARSTPPAPPQTAADTDTYTVVAGDSCRSIANRVLGSAQAIIDLHRLNPQLGPTPHNLVVGQQLRVPRRGKLEPDANLTAARGDVAVRKPTEAVWDAAERGMGLFRFWRVGARAKASAELTFRDSSQLRLRENTVVIIYGRSVPRSPVVAMRAEIEGGSLEARLAAASGGPGPEVLTPSSLAVLTQGHALFSVDAAGTSLIANHAGQPVAVRAVTKQKQPRGAAVKVASGMGSRVEVGKLPEPPRPLPPPPAFAAPQLTVSTFAASSSVRVAWQPAAAAIRYRAVVLDEQGVEQNVVLVPPGETAFELASVPAGALKVQLSSIDATGFEGVPSTLDVNVVSVAMAPPGSGSTAGATSNSGLPTMTTPLKVAVGAKLVPPPGMTCALEPDTDTDGATADLVARKPGRYHAVCSPTPASPTPPSSATSTLSSGGISSVVEVLPVTAAPIGALPPLARDRATSISLAVASEAPLGPDVAARGSAGLTIEAQRWEGTTLVLSVRPTAAATAAESIQLAVADVELTAVSVAIADAAPVVAARAPSWTLDLGGFAGVLLPADGSELGTPTVGRDELASGPLLGARLAARQTARPWLAGRLELGVAALSQVGTPDTATLLLPSAAIALRPLARGGVELWAFGGAGLARLASAPNSIQPDSALSLDGGAGLQVHHSGLVFRLDATWSLVDPGGAAEVWPSLRLGIASTFER